MSMDRETEIVLQQAAGEIRRLRRENALMAAKLEGIEIAAMMVSARPPERQGEVMGEDIAYRIDGMLHNEKERREKAEREAPRADKPSAVGTM